VKLIGEGFYWDELSVGAQFRTFGRTITETDVVNFISCTGMLEGLVLNATAQGTGLAFLHTEMNVLGPTLVNDTIHVELEVTEVKAASKLGRGLVRTRNRVINQHGETVLEHTPLRLMAGRSSPS
jgi:acyl dehydratase